MSGPEESVNYFLIRALAIAMLEGNKLYESLKTKGLLTNINLTVPEAIKYTGKKFGLSEWVRVPIKTPSSLNQTNFIIEKRSLRRTPRNISFRTS